MSSQSSRRFTQIEVGDTTEPTRAVDVEDGQLVTSADGPAIKAGGSADIYYRVSAEETDGEVRWVTDQLDNEHRRIDLSKKRVMGDVRGLGGVDIERRLETVVLT